MPPADQMADDTLLRVLAYGDSMTKKTWWLGTAAEAGYNVLLLNGDGNETVLRNIPAEARKRIHIINCMDAIDKQVFSPLVAKLFKKSQVIWNDDLNQVQLSRSDTTHGRYVLDLTKLDHNWVLGTDSYTALVMSTMFQYIDENKMSSKSILDYLEENMKGNREYYFFATTFMDWFLKQSKSVPCHHVVIAHAEQWEKYKKDPASGKEVIDFTRFQPIGTSHNQGRKLCKNFTDVMIFKKRGGKYAIDVSNTPNQDSGSRVLAPKTYDWDELSFGKLAELHGCKKPDPAAKSSGCIYIPAGVELPAGASVAEPVKQGKPSPLQGQGKAKSIGSLLNKEKVQ